MCRGVYSLLCTICPFFIINCFADLLRSASSECSALLNSHSLGVRSGVINICFKWSGVDDSLSLLTFRKIAAFSSSNSTVIFKSLGFGPPLFPSLIALEMRGWNSSWECSMSLMLAMSRSLRDCGWSELDSAILCIMRFSLRCCLSFNNRWYHISKLIVSMFMLYVTTECHFLCY